MKNIWKSGENRFFIILMSLGALMYLSSIFLGPFIENLIGISLGQGLIHDLVLGGILIIVIGFLFKTLGLIEVNKRKFPWIKYILFGAAVLYASRWVLMGLGAIGVVTAIPFLSIIISGVVGILAVDFIVQKTGIMII